MTAPPSLTVTPIAGLPLFAPGMSIAAEVLDSARRAGEPIGDDDAIVIAQKIVSKADGRLRDLSDVTPGAESLRLAGATGRDPALIELILSESRAIVRASPAAIIAEHRTGHVLANAGIDASNVEGGDQGTVLLWPVDPDDSARAIREDLMRLAGVRPAIVIADSMGRAWRIGTVGAAIGCAGIPAFEDRRGETDLFGRVLQATIIGVVDSIAAIATLAMGEGAEATPAAIVRGAGRWITADHGAGAAAGLRPHEQDMFR